jgi:organic hydroperoxide reductase OsmC/OhrA
MGRPNICCLKESKGVSLLTAPQATATGGILSQYSAVISWAGGDEPFVDKRYSRAHRWEFDGGVVLRASSSPHSVPVPYSDPGAIDPEEAFVAALSSCHMLWFLSIAAKGGFRVQAYRDEAVGVMGKNTAGKLCITTVTLRPHVIFRSSKVPSAATVVAMHEEAHRECYIANSVTTVVTAVPTFEIAAPAP